MPPCQSPRSRDECVTCSPASLDDAALARGALHSALRIRSTRRSRPRPASAGARQASEHRGFIRPSNRDRGRHIACDDRIHPGGVRSAFSRGNRWLGELHERRLPRDGWRGTGRDRALGRARDWLEAGRAGDGRVQPVQLDSQVAGETTTQGLPRRRSRLRCVSWFVREGILCEPDSERPIVGISMVHTRRGAHRRHPRSSTPIVPDPGRVALRAAEAGRASRNPNTCLSRTGNQKREEGAPTWPGP